MSRGMAGHSLYRKRRIYKSFYGRISVIQFFQFASLKSLCYRIFRRNKLCNPVHITVRHFKHTSDVADCRSRFKRSEGNYLAYMIVSVTVFNIFYYLSAAFIAEIYIKIRHAYTFRIKEAFKKQIILQ